MSLYKANYPVALYLIHCAKASPLVTEEQHRAIRKAHYLTKRARENDRNVANAFSAIAESLSSVALTDFEDDIADLIESCGSSNPLAGSYSTYVGLLEAKVPP